MILNQGLDGVSLIVQGDSGPNDIQVSFDAAAGRSPTAGPSTPADGCVSTGATVRQLPGRDATGLVVITGGDGDDSINITESVPAGVKVRANGNAGSDTLSGGPGDDVLEAGENYNSPDNGNDTLTATAAATSSTPTRARDHLSGGPGNDLLVSSVAVCQGHIFSGGPGDDTVSYGRSDAAMQVRLGGTGGPAGCGNTDQVRGDNESLEGSDGPDVLIGDNGDNSFLGHLGADTFIGKGGNDFIDAVGWQARQGDRLRRRRRRRRRQGLRRPRLPSAAEPRAQPSAKPSSPSSGTNLQGPMSAARLHRHGG